MRRMNKLASVVLLLHACGGGDGPRTVPGPIVLEGGHGTLEIGTDPFSVTLVSGEGEPLFSTATDPVDAGDSGLAYGTFASLNPFHYYNPAHAEPGDGSDARWIPKWHAAGVVTQATETTGGWDLLVDVPGEVGQEIDVSVRLEPDAGFRLELAVRDPGVVAFTRLGFDRPPDEHFYGLGERLDRADAAGGAYEMVTGLGDLDSNLNEVHVPVPFYVSSRGYGLFYEDPHPSFFDFGTAAAGRVRATWSTSEPLVLHVITGGTPLEVASRYGRMTGPAALPPIWAFSPFQWRNELDSRDQLLEDARAIRANDIPGSCIWIDNPWQTAYNTFLFNPVQFPDAATMLAELESLGFRNMVWSTPYLDYTDDRWVEGMEPDTGGLYEEALDAGYFVSQSDGSAALWTWTGDKSGGTIDFTNPDAFAWWQDLIGRVTSMGVVGFKLDYGEATVPGTVLDAASDFVFANGETATTMSKTYSILYHRAYRERAIADGGEAFILGRSSTYGGQRHVEAIWPGDLDASFLEHREPNDEGRPAVGGLPAAIAAAQNLSVSGFPAFGSDTGGYRGDGQDKELLLRWAEHTALTPIMQLGGGDHHNVWDLAVYDAETLDVYRRYARLHTRLFPLWYTLASAATADGTPPLRPVGFAYPEDPGAAAAWDEYMVGDQLLVAPVRDQGAVERVVHFPPGRWVDWFTGEVHEGPSDETVEAPLDALPLYLRFGAIVPMIADDVDTFVETTVDELVTLDERRDRLWLRIVPSGPSSLSLFEGGSVGCLASGGGVDVTVTAGTWFARWVLEIDLDDALPAPPADPTGVAPDGSPLTESADPTAVASGACDGCWSYDATTGKVFVSIGSPGTVRISY